MKTPQHVPILWLFTKFQLNLVFTLLLCSCFSNCKNYKVLKYRSYSQIELLKDQALLVRLNTSQHSIDALKKANKEKEAGIMNERTIAAPYSSDPCALLVISGLFSQPFSLILPVFTHPSYDLKS